MNRSYHDWAEQADDAADERRRKEITRLRQRLATIMSYYDDVLWEDTDLGQIDVRGYDLEDQAEMVILVEEIQELENYGK